MRSDHRPLWLKRLTAAYTQRWAEHFLCPRFDSVGSGFRVINPRCVDVQGVGVTLGRNVHIMATRDRYVRLTTFSHGGRSGRVEVGAYSIILPGVRLTSAASIRTGKNCMFAHNVYVTDADWHDLYDRTEAPGANAPVVLGDNVWLGDSAIVCKGVTIGDNSVVGAGAVVSRDVPPNTVVVGNPAVPVKTLDPSLIRRRREDLFSVNESCDDYFEDFERWVLRDNRFRTWLRAVLWPNRSH